jgi:hypothetical protein
MKIHSRFSWRHGYTSALLILIFLLGRNSVTLAGDSIPTQNLGKPTFEIPGLPAGQPLRIVAYGDMRFTDASNHTDTNPRVRQWLVNRVLEERPDALLLTGDLPFRGSKPEDWQVYQQETAAWRQAGLRVFTTLGNHELYPDIPAGLENYFANFPELRGHRWYSVRMGSVYVLSLDSLSHLAAGSPQREWVRAQLAAMPPEINFIFVLSHMPMMADMQSEILVHLPAQEQADFRDFLEAESHSFHAQVVVVNGHIHNYERFERGGITYLISGGGGARPYPILVRGSQDLYQAPGFPNFHYLVFTIEGKHADASMFRVVDPNAESLSVEEKDTFTLDAK